MEEKKNQTKQNILLVYAAVCSLNCGHLETKMAKLLLLKFDPSNTDVFSTQCTALLSYHQTAVCFADYSGT